jgi:hypothetical protein
MLNSDNTRGYLISRLLPLVCGFGRGAALPSGPFYLEAHEFLILTFFHIQTTDS